MKEELLIRAAWRRARALEKLLDRSSRSQPIETSRETPATHSTPRLTTRTNSHNPRILLVEDDDAVADAWLMVLELEGFEVIHASSGSEALRLLTCSAHPIDLVISDYHLPGGMNGAEVVCAVRNLWGTDLPAILVTGDASMSECVARDVRRMNKPFDSEQLIDRIRDIPFSGGRCSSAAR